MTAREYDVLTNFGNIIVQYDLVRQKTNAFILGERAVELRDAPLLPIMLCACLSDDELSVLGCAIEERRSLEINGRLFVIEPHQSPECLLERIRGNYRGEM